MSREERLEKALKAISGYCNMPEREWEKENPALAKFLREADGWSERVDILCEVARTALDDA